MLTKILILKIKNFEIKVFAWKKCVIQANKKLQNLYYIVLRFLLPFFHLILSDMTYPLACAYAGCQKILIVGGPLFLGH